MGQFASLPDKLSFCITFLSGYSVRTRMVWAWKYGQSFLKVITRANASLSIWGYHSSTSCSALLTKYTDFCTPSSSQIRAALIAIGETARYKYNTSLEIVLLNRGVLAKYFFNWKNASSHLSDHSKAFLNILKKWRHLSIDREMNRFNAANLLVSYWSCFVVFGDCISRIAWIFSGLALIPLLETT